jgi:hypothetical protein
VTGAAVPSTPATVARYALGSVRLVMGTAALLLPRTMTRRLGAVPEEQPAVAYVWRLFGVRTVILGAELLVSRPGPVRDQVVLLAPIIHASDTTAALLAGRSGVLPPAAARTATLVSGLNTVLAVVSWIGARTSGQSVTRRSAAHPGAASVIPA